ncbi:hypothetical protein F0A16_06555 [Salinicola corii]|uniref:Sulfotransferase family protein n=1 Tax=Salinicola corii TaxID=2606937 RepID=A0A640WFL8_9GAMM|nr:hypothetical protein [Salinicola corii]KAA0019012.1 hypothetical protein F0A16_06555 [Salinicola corii]
MEKLILHLGVHKTATTHFQSRFWNSREKLAKKEVSYLGLNETRAFFTSQIGAKKKEIKAEAKLFVKAAKCGLISDENILGGTDKPKGTSAYKDAEGRLGQFLDLVGVDRIETHVTIRDPEAYLISRYCEYLRHYPYLNIGEYFDEMFVRDFSWVPLIEIIKKVTSSEPVVTTFESIFENEEEYLKKVTGVDLEFEPASVSHSVKRSKISQEAYDILSLVAEHYPGHMVRKVLDTIDRNRQLSKSSPLKPFSKSLSEHLKERYEKDKEVLGLA